MGYTTLLDQSVFFSQEEGGSQPDEPRIAASSLRPINWNISACIRRQPRQPQGSSAGPLWASRDEAPCALEERESSPQGGLQRKGPGGAPRLARAAADLLSLSQRSLLLVPFPGDVRFGSGDGSLDENHIIQRNFIHRC